MNVTHWHDLGVYDADGNHIGTMLDLFQSGGTELEKIDGISADGGIDGWEGYYIASPGEEPDWDTPRGPVDWDGFADDVKTRVLGITDNRTTV